MMRIQIRKKANNYGKLNHGGGTNKKATSKEQKPIKKTTNKILSASEKRCEAYARVNGACWIPPTSPHRLLQEEHKFDHWRVLVICILLNKTPGEKVRKILPDFFKVCPNADVAKDVPASQLAAIIQPLGFSKLRAKTIKRFSRDYLDPNWAYVTQLYGINKYAADAYAIFCAGRWKSVIPEDHKLVEYWRFLKTHENTVESCCDK